MFVGAGVPRAADLPEIVTIEHLTRASSSDTATARSNPDYDTLPVLRNRDTRRGVSEWIRSTLAAAALRTVGAPVNRAGSTATNTVV